jgi:alcohol dehydrogenase (cytochrome c)
MGELQAWDLAGSKVWSYKFPNQRFASAMVPGGDLVFIGGTNDRYFGLSTPRTVSCFGKFKTNLGISAGPPT